VLFFLLLSSLAVAAETPPKVLYHVGHRAFLEEDEKAGTIPDKAWNENIMGRGTRYGLVPWRRGLYGGDSVDSLELYANLLLGSPKGTPKEPWLLKITLKEECRQPDAVTDLATDERYLDWLLRNVGGFLQSVPFCLDLSAEACNQVITGTQRVASGREENTCDDILQSFMEEANPRVVEDEEWKGSWYLRDRACIEKLEASPESALEALRAAHWDWQSRKDAYSGTSGGYGLGYLSILMGALSDAKHVDEATLSELARKLAESDIHQNFQKSSRVWLKDAGPAIVLAYRRCRAAGETESFRQASRAFRAKLNEAAFLKNADMPDILTSSFGGICSAPPTRP
jgi:hypothetical protein